eukprot:TRINITY_DN3732_c0_g1_i10.p2 TRINITY_DN3732_c0_g1~~TRINITY_DN3732_c0_g1_i10.p2  ORF type:complete len:113 (+),score=25.62 TRINITY_DN3732_c0_g1_i10:125-463(+)
MRKNETFAKLKLSPKKNGVQESQSTLPTIDTHKGRSEVCPPSARLTLETDSPEKGAAVKISSLGAEFPESLYSWIGNNLGEGFVDDYTVELEEVRTKEAPVALKSRLLQGLQ